MTKLLLYIGHENYTGIFQDSSNNIRRKFKEADPHIEDIEVTAKQLIENIREDEKKEIGWEKKTIVVFPGGTPTAWDGQLKVNKIKMLRDFVLRGGNMFLVCAGAYFSMEATTFVYNSEYRIDKKRELSLFPGKGIGPLDPKTLNISYPKSFGSHVVVKDEMTGETAKMYFKEGGYFEPSKDPLFLPDFKILHTYLDGKIASGMINLGEGRAIMSFFHAEYDDTPKLINFDPKTESFFSDLQAHLNESIEYRKKFYEKCLNLFIKRGVDEGIDYSISLSSVIHP